MADDATIEELPASIEALAFAPGRPLGEGLRAAREFAGLSLDDISELTKVRSAYLAALEDMDIGRMPSRPFVEGYVRAYAGALGLDETRALARFRADAPHLDEGMPNPLGIDNESDPRRNILIMVGVVIVVAIVIWNIAQRAINSSHSQVGNDAVKVEKTPPEVIGAVTLEPLTPPPVEATLPPPYVTPGLEDADPVVAATIQAAAAEAALAQTPPIGQALLAKGPVTGVAASDSRLILQATSPVVLVIRQAQTVLDIKSLTEGQAYRTPTMAGVVIDASMPSSVDYYIDGKRAGALVDSVTPVSKLMQGVKPLPPPPAAPAAATGTAPAGQAATPAPALRGAASPPPAPATAPATPRPPA